MSQVVPGWASLLIFLLVLFLIGVMEGIQVVDLVVAFPMREPPRLPWLNSSCKTRPRTRQPTQRLTGRQALPRWSASFSLWKWDPHFCSGLARSRPGEITLSDSSWVVRSAASLCRFTVHAPGLCCMSGLLCCKADNNPREITRRISLPSSGSCSGGRNVEMPKQFNPQTLLLETGLLACVVVVIVAQLTPQIIASVYPVRYVLHLRLSFLMLMSSSLAHRTGVFWHT